MIEYREAIKPDAMITLPVISESALAAGSTSAPPRASQPFVTGALETPAGTVLQVSSTLHRRDRWGAFKARWGIGRMDQLVDPGLYALGAPCAMSEVFVSANYKLSFDALRAALPGMNAWILVLDTRGINVWCAAGKGTFGTNELVFRIEACKLAQVVQHRRLILPQLGAPGVAAHEVRRRTGFKVHYGPVRAADLQAYLDGGLKATKQMRQVTFGLKDRAILIPMELTIGLKPFALIASVFLLIATIAGYAAGAEAGIAGWLRAFQTEGLFAVIALGAAFMAGAVLHPLLLPYLPARAFSLQGLMVGLAVAIVLISWRGGPFHEWSGLLEAAAWLCIIPAISAYLAMNFTGCSTYTSLSGVKKEMRWAMPAEIMAAAVGCVFWLASRVTSMGGIG
ncbi:MAG: mercury methylation corrinoid protein HgcA [Smithellaceae bacterium]